MKVSIIIPVYKVSDYVERCLNSVIAQTYTDIECIIVDDCTPDDSIEKCERLIAKYNGPIEFKILHHEHNRGLSAARNTGINAAIGKYVFFLDGDDEITPDAILVMLKEMFNHPSLEMVIGNVLSEPHDDYYNLKTPTSPYYIQNNNDFIRLLFLKPEQIVPVMAWNKLIQLDFIKEYNLYFKEGIIHEDEHWIFFVIKHIKSVSFINDDTYIHYSTPNSIMTSTSQTKRSDTLLFIIYDIIKNIDQPYSDLQLLKYLDLLLTLNNQMSNRNLIRKTNILLITKLLYNHFFSIAFHFFIYKYRNRSFQKLKYSIIPNIRESLYINYFLTKNGH